MNKLLIKKISYILFVGLIISCVNNVNAQVVDPNFTPPPTVRKAVINSMAATLDGKILLSGEITIFGEKKVHNLIRLNADGSLDETFSFDVLPYMPLTHIALLSTGEIIFSGNGFLGKAEANGKIIKIINALGYTSSLEIQEDDKILFSGYSSSNPALERYNTDLTKDTDFNQAVTLNSSVTAIAFQDNKILIAGGFSIVNGQPKNSIARLNMDGSLDNLFDTGLGTEDYIGSLTVTLNGKIYIGNTYINSFNGNRTNSPLIRLNYNGSLDNTFTPSRSIENVGKIINQGNDIVLMNVLRIDYNSAYYILKVKENGSLDSSFSKREVDDFWSALLMPFQDKILSAANFKIGKDYGVAMLNSDGSEIVTFAPEVGRDGLITAGDYANGKLIVGGDFLRIGDLKTYNVAQLNSNGSIDTSFRIAENAGIVSEVKYVDSNKVLIATTNEFYKVNSQGAIDNTFNFIRFKNLYQVVDFKLVDEGKIIAIGPNDLYRLNPDGSEDLTFKMGDGITGGSRSTAFGCDITVDKKILFGSAFTEYNHVPAKQIVRLNQDGSVDNTLNVGSGPNGFAIDFVKALPNLDILLYGYFNRFNDISTPQGFVKISEEGKVDTTFNKQLPFSFMSVKDIATFNNHILMAGYSTIISINYDGSLNNSFNVPWSVIGSGSIEKILKTSEKDVFLLGRSFGAEGKNIVKLILSNSSPVITGTKLPGTIAEDTPFDITVNDLVIEDADNTSPDDFSIKILPGSNYSVSGTRVTPNKNFYGNIEITVHVNDGTDDSEPYKFGITVLPVNDAPVITGVKSPYSAFFLSPFKIEIKNLLVTDPDNKSTDFRLKVLPGSDYQVYKNIVILTSPGKSTFEVYVSVNDGLTDSEIFSIPVTVKRITDPCIYADVFFYPNPVNDLAKITGYTVTSSSEIRIINSIGKETVYPIESVRNESLDLSSYPSGFYYIVIKEKGKLIANKKVYKN